MSPSKLVKTRMAKSVLDAGWATFKHMLRYKSAIRRGAFVEVSERWSTQTCSDCGVVGGPKGLEGLGVRRWVCECGVSHDRDVNAARNILASGRSVVLQGTEIVT
jgi:putative transposase